MTVGLLARVEASRALEALRSGVPNSDAVTVLGTWQQPVVERFEARLRELETEEGSPRRVRGILISGGFGTGKSHLLEHLRHRALSANLMCSRVVVSKETPLHDLGRMFSAAAAAAELPAGTGEAITELSERLNPESAAHRRFRDWAGSERSGVSALFPASLLVHERMRDDPEVVAEISSFWGGAPPQIPQLRQALRRCGAASLFALRRVAARQLAAERFLFTARLARGAGLAGWVILIDEVELIGRYGPVQRGRSYAELARWMGRSEVPGFPGILAVAAITDDFDISVLQEKGDLAALGPRLRNRDAEDAAQLAGWAETGMRLIQRDALPLSPPSEEILRDAHDRLRAVHGAAYGWEAPPAGLGPRSLQRPVRAYVRRWINEWDLRRLHPQMQLDTEEEVMTPSYEESPGLDEPPA